MADLPRSIQKNSLIRFVYGGGWVKSAQTDIGPKRIDRGPPEWQDTPTHIPMKTNPMLPIWHFLTIVALLLPFAVRAQEFENGDFSRGRERWSGDARVVYLTADGQISSKKEEGQPIMEIPLQKTAFTDLSQKFHTREKVMEMEVEVVYRGSDNFARNDSAPRYSSLDWKPGGVFYWSANEFLRVSLCLKLKDAGYCYGLADVKPGGDWQTYKVHWKQLKGLKEHEIWILAPPGEGSIFVKSVKVK